MLKDLTATDFIPASCEAHDDIEDRFEQLSKVFRIAFDRLERAGLTRKLAEDVVQGLRGTTQPKKLFPYCYLGLQRLFEKGDTYLTNGSAVYYIPDGWLSKTPASETTEPVCYCYVARAGDTNAKNNMAQWITLNELDQCWRIQEEPARELQPLLFAHLQRIKDKN